MNKQALIAGAALVLSGWLVGVTAQQTTDGETVSRQQGGWVIEMDGEGQPQAETETPAAAAAASQPVQRGSTGVELIVGGQGSGGVAKKATLPVID